MKYLVAPGATPDEAAALAIQNGCGGYYLSVPPVWQAQADADGWTYPGVVTLDESGLVASYTPAVV
jgi:hypothetical protein